MDYGHFCNNNGMGRICCDMAMECTGSFEHGGKWEEDTLDSSVACKIKKYIGYGSSVFLSMYYRCRKLNAGV